MKRRKYFAMVLMLSGIMAFAGCGNEKKNEKEGETKIQEEDTQDDVGDEDVSAASSHENALDFKVGDYVKLGEYKNLKVQYPTPEVSEDDLQYTIEELQEENTEYKEITDRSAQEGDSVNIDYTGVIDGEAFEGGSDTDYELVLGSGDFLEEFESSLVGKNSGEAVTFPVTFPEDYFDSEMAGKQAEFTVTINKISQVIVPEYTDEFVAKATDYSTMKEYEEYIRKDLEASAQEESISAAGEEALSLAVENATVDGYPQELYDFFYDETVAGYEFYASMMGMEYEEFVEQMGEDSVESGAIAQTNEFLVVQAIAEKEGLTVTEENYKDEAKELMEENEYETLDEFEKDYGKVSIIVQLVRGKIVNFLYENAQIEEVSQEEYYGDEDDFEDEEDVESGEEDAGDGEEELNDELEIPDRQEEGDEEAELLDISDTSDTSLESE